MINAFLFEFIRCKTARGLQGLGEAKTHYINLSRVFAVASAIASQVAKAGETAAAGDPMVTDHGD